MKKNIKVLAIILIVFMLAPNVIKATSVNTEKSAIIKRLAGKDRVKTAIEASKEIYKDVGTKNVILAGYNGEVDALTGTILASAKDGPLLLTKNKSLSEDTEKEINRLGAKNIYILGGEKVVSLEVENRLKSLRYKVKRIAGKDREETALAVAKETNVKTDHIFLVLGWEGKGGTLADALAIGPVSAIKKSPVFLTDKNKIKNETLKAIENLEIKEITIIGGEKAINKTVESQLKNYKVDRISGKNREETALAIADEYFIIPERSILASGYSTADALVGGYVGAKRNAPILLTNTNVISESTEYSIENYTSELYILGGENTVSDKILKKAKTATNVKKTLDITIDKDMKLDKNYRSIRLRGNNVELDLNKKNVQDLIVSSKDTLIKNGKTANINVEKESVNLTLEDLTDTIKGQHSFAGEGGKPIILKGNTELKGNIDILSKTPTNILGQNLNKEKGITGKVIIKTNSEVTIEAPVNILEVQKNNKKINIKANINKIIALANIEVTMDKYLPTPKVERAKETTAFINKDGGKKEDFLVNDELKATDTTGIEAEEKPEPGPGAPSRIVIKDTEITGDAIYGSTLTAKLTPTGASGTYQWMRADSKEGTYKVIDKATEATYSLSSDDTGKYIKVEVKGTGRYTGLVTSQAVIKITPKPVIINVNNSSKVYGQDDPDFSGTVGDLVNKDDLGVVTYVREGTDSNAGIYKDVLSASFTSNPNYTVEVKKGELKITKGTYDISGIVFEDATHNYDGIAKNLVSTGMPEGVTVTYENNDKVNAGLYEVTAKFTGDVINYETIPDKTASLNLIPKDVTITPENASKIYDGRKIISESTISTGLLSGHKVESVKLEGSQLFVGESTNIASDAIIQDSNGNDVTSNYKITYLNGSLVITKAEIPLTLTGSNGEKIYDGTELTKNSHSIEGSLAEGDYISVTVEGSIIDVGIKANAIASVKVMHGETDVTENYKITSVSGQLKITRAMGLNLAITDYKDIYDRNAHSIKVDNLIDGDTLEYSVDNKATWTSVKPEFTDAGTYKVDVRVNNKNYIKREGSGTVEISKKDAKILVGNTEKLYGGEYSIFTGSVEGLLNNDNLGLVKYKKINTGLNEDEDLNKDGFLNVGKYDGQLGVDYTNNPNYTIDIIPGNLTVTKKYVTITANSDEFTYDGESHSNQGYIVEGLVGKDQITATLEGSITYPIQISVMNKIESYSLTGIDSNNYYIELVDGELKMNKASIPLTIQATSLEKPYDGEKLEASFTSIGTLAKNDNIVANVQGSIINAGEVANIIKDVKVMNNATDVTENYNITKADGTLKIIPRPLTITADSQIFTYNGNEQKKASYVVDGLVSADTITAKVEGSIANVGTVENKVTEYTLTNGDLNNYSVKKVNGNLTITKRQIRLIANSETVPYDGLTHTVSGYTITSDSVTPALVESHSISGVTAKGSGRELGSYYVTFTGTPKITVGEIDVTNNYNITGMEAKGKLEINPVVYSSKENLSPKNNVNVGTKKTTVLYGLPKKIKIIGKENQEESANIQWTSNEDGFDIPGKYTAIGTIVLPTGWVNSENQPLTINGTIVVGTEVESISSYNSHKYIYISNRLRWDEARKAAEEMFDSETGQRGYLATITSAGENNFVAGLIPSDSWIGGSDRDLEGTWKWETGPEKGRIICKALHVGNIPNELGYNRKNMLITDIAEYVNFDFVIYSDGSKHYIEPDGWTDESELSIQSNGIWSDFSGPTGWQSRGYIVEFGGL